MLEAKIPAISFRRIFDAIKELVDTTNIEFSANGMELQAVDTSHVALVHLQLRAEAFEQYRCDADRALGVNLCNFTRILRSSDTKDTLTIKHGGDENKAEYSECMRDAAQSGGDTIFLSFEDLISHRRADCKIKLMNLDEENLGIPDNQYENVVEMSSAAFLRICRDLSQLGEAITIEVTKGTVNFCTSGQIADVSICHCTQGHGEDTADVISVQCNDPLSQPFGSKYLAIFSKAAPLSSTVTLSLAANLPLMVEFKLEENSGFVRFYLAPKMDE